jgi:crescentin
VGNDSPARNLPMRQDAEGHRGDDAAVHRSEEGEALHRLLVNTSRKIDNLDALKSALDDMVLPFRGAMRALDQERALSANLSRQLGEKAAAYDKLRDELQHAENKTRVLETETEGLRDALDRARVSGYETESARALLSDEIKRRDEKIAALERQLVQEMQQRRSLSEGFRTLQEQGFQAETRITELQDALGEAGQACEALKHDKRSLWRSAEQARDEAERMGRRVAEGETMLSAIRVELGKVEARHVEVCSERNRLADAVNDLRGQREAEGQRFNGRVETLEARAAVAERQVAEMRQRLIERTEEARAFICKAAEATIARASAERRLAALQVSQGVRGQGDDDPTETRTALSEFLRALNLRSREMALAGSAEKLAALTERKRGLAAGSQSQRTGAGRGIEDVMAALSADRQPRGDIEDALEAARKANARLESEVASLRSGLEDAAGAAGAPKWVAPDKTASKPPPIASPKPRIRTTGSGALGYEAGLVAQLRRHPEDDDPARSVA